MQVVVDELLTNYKRIGNGKPVLLLHGWADNLETFNAIESELVQDFDLIAIDLPGFGKSQQPKIAWKLEDYTRFLRKFLEKIDTEPYCVIGHSNGGALAIKGVANRDLKTQKLILLASSGIRTTQSFRRFFIKIIAKTGKLLTFFLPQATKDKLKRKLYGTVGSDMLVAEHMQETFRLTVKQDVLKDSSSITIPTLLIYGDKDKATPSNFGEKFSQAIKGSQLKIITGATHFVHHDNPDEVAKYIKEFLE